MQGRRKVGFLGIFQLISWINKSKPWRVMFVLFFLQAIKECPSSVVFLFPVVRSSLPCHSFNFKAQRGIKPFASIKKINVVTFGIFKAKQARSGDSLWMLSMRRAASFVYLRLYRLSFFNVLVFNAFLRSRLLVTANLWRQKIHNSWRHYS